MMVYTLDPWFQQRVERRLRTRKLLAHAVDLFTSLVGSQNSVTFRNQQLAVRRRWFAEATLRHVTTVSSCPLSTSERVHLLVYGGVQTHSEQLGLLHSRWRDFRDALYTGK